MQCKHYKLDSNVTNVRWHRKPCWLDLTFTNLQVHTYVAQMTTNRHVGHIVDWSFHIWSHPFRPESFTVLFICCFFWPCFVFRCLGSLLFDAADYKSVLTKPIPWNSFLSRDSVNNLHAKQQSSSFPGKKRIRDRVLLWPFNHCP